MNGFDEMQTLRAEIVRLNEENDRLRMKIGDLGEEMGVLIQQRQELAVVTEKLLAYGSFAVHGEHGEKAAQDAVAALAKLKGASK